MSIPAVYLPEPTPAALGALLRASRKSAGLRVADAASLVGRTIQSVYAWETGKSPISAVTAVTLFRAYGVISLVWPGR